MKTYKVKIEMEIEAKNEKEALKEFWEKVDDSTYPVKPSVCLGWCEDLSK